MLLKEYPSNKVQQSNVLFAHFLHMIGHSFEICVTMETWRSRKEHSASVFILFTQLLLRKGCARDSLLCCGTTDQTDTLVEYNTYKAAE